MPINFTYDPPAWVDINRGKLQRLVLLAAYQIHESTGSFIERMEADEDERSRPKTPNKKRRSPAKR